MAGWIFATRGCKRKKFEKIFSPNIGETWWFNMVYKVVKKSPFSNNPVVIMAKLGDKFRLPVSFWGSCSRRRAASEFGLLFAAFCWGLSPDACHLKTGLQRHISPGFNQPFFFKKPLGSFLLQIRYILQSLGGFPFSHSCQGRNEHVYFTTVGVVCA